LDALYVTSREDLYGISSDPAVVMQVIQMQQQVQTAGIREVYPRAQLLLLEREGEPIGRVVVDVGRNDIRLVDIAIVPRHRRHGAARAVLHTLQAAAQAQGLAMTVAAAKFNEAARQLYGRMGFVVRSDDGVIEQLVWPASRLTVPPPVQGA
jgi:GNAT superfamily N-acetyltransferase